MPKAKLLSVLNLVAFLIAFAISNGSQLRVISGKTIADVSNKYDSYFTPAGITFAIWGLIYLSLLIFCIRHIVHAYSKNRNSETEEDIIKMGWLFIINNLGASLWVFAWINELLLMSVILIIIQLLSLILISIRLHIYNPHKSYPHKFLTQVPLSIYLGWICIASIANITVWLLSIGWDSFGIPDAYWAIIMIGVATLLTLYLVFVRRNLIIAGVVIWALYGILLKNNLREETLYTIEIFQAAITSIAVILLSFIIQAVKNIRLAYIQTGSPYSN